MVNPRVNKYLGMAYINAFLPFLPFLVHLGPYGCFGLCSLAIQECWTIDLLRYIHTGNNRTETAKHQKTSPKRDCLQLGTLKLTKEKVTLFGKHRAA